MFATCIRRVYISRGQRAFLRSSHKLPPSSPDKPLDMIKGEKPVQQAKLAEIWGGKRKQEEAPTEAMDVDETASKQPNTNHPVKVEIGRPVRKRRMVESDDDSNDGSHAALLDAPTTPPSMSSKPSSRTNSVPESPVRLKSKGKMNAAVKAGAEPQKTPVAAPSENEEGEEGIESEDDIEDDDRGASSAEAVLSRKDEVDVKGGWKLGDPVPYAAVTKAFSLIEGTTKRLEKTAILAAFFLLVIQRSVKGDNKSLLQSVYLCINRLSPDYVGIELGIGESLLLKAIAESTGRSLALIKADLKKEGDLGLVAMRSKNTQKTLFKPKPLTVPIVFSNLREIALSSGHSSQSKKVSIITKLLASCQDFEAKYIVRSLEGKLRIGNAERTVLVALAHAVVLAEKERGKKWSKEKLAEKLEQASGIIKAVYSELPSYDLLVPALLEHGIEHLREHCKLTPGVPLKPMLAKPTKAIGEVLDRFEGKRFTCEYKYDGERAQVHKLEDGTIGIFSRNSEDMSKKYPDLVNRLPRCINDNTKSFVFDSEAVAIDKDTGRLMPFQELSRRKRKDVKVEDIQVRVSLFAFDLLYLNGEPLLHRPLSERRELLRKHFHPVDGEFDFAKSSDSETIEEIQSFLEESVKDGCEGLMVKMLESDASFYEPSRRSVNWLKVKKDYLAGVGDSLDLVVVGGYYGKGKRTNVYGAFLLACYDPESEEYQTICKIGTGFSEEALQSHHEALKALETTRARGDIKPGGAKPDVWFEPKIVWEVLAADLSLSPVYTAAHGLADERGISLRFPRFLRVRDDKSADDATGPDQVAEMYERQVLANRKSNKKGRDGDDGFW